MMFRRVLQKIFANTSELLSRVGVQISFRRGSTDSFSPDQRWEVKHRDSDLYGMPAKKIGSIYVEIL